MHQLRNPTLGLRTYAQLLLRRLEADSQHRGLVEGMLTEQTRSASTSMPLMGLGGTDTAGRSLDPRTLLLPPRTLPNPNVTMQGTA